MRFLRWLLLGFGVLFLLLANLLWWVDGTLFNTDRFAGAVDNTLAQPEVQDRLATVISQEVAKGVDVQDRLQQTLPDDFKFLASFAGDEIEQEVAYRVSLRLLSSGLTADVRNAIVEGLHERVVATLESDNDRLVQAEGNSLVLDLRPAINRVFERLGMDVPDRVQAAEDQGRGVVTLVDNTQALQQASFFVSNRVVFLFLALLLGAACLAGQVLLEPDRMRGASRAGFAIAAVGVLTLLIVFVATQLIPDNRVVLRELVSNFVVNLRRQSIVIVVLGAAIVLLADAKVRASLVSARHSLGTYTQRLGTTPLLIAVGVFGLVLFLA
jgi:hypothetical protein